MSHQTLTKSVLEGMSGVCKNILLSTQKQRKLKDFNKPPANIQALQKRDLASDPRGEKQVVALLSIPLETYDTVTVLGLHNYPSLMALLSPPTCRQMAVTIVKSILDAGTLVSSETKVELLFGFIAPLVRDIPGALDDTDDEVRHWMFCVLWSPRRLVGSTSHSP